MEDAIILRVQAGDLRYNQVMGYNLLIELCILALCAKAMERYNWKFYWAALCAVAVPVLIFAAIGLISGYASAHLLLASKLVTIICQYVAALVVFRFLLEYEDTIATWFIWLLGGGAVIFVIIPPAVMNLSM